jgi:hypothetical protein
MKKTIIMRKSEELKKAIMWVLTEIEKENIATPKGKYVYFEPLTNNHNISITDQRRALKVLENEGAIKIQEEKHLLGIMKMQAELYNWKPMGYFLNVLQPRFNEFYEDLKEQLCKKEKYSHYSIESIKKILCTLEYLKKEWELSRLQ